MVGRTWWVGHGGSGMPDPYIDSVGSRHASTGYHVAPCLYNRLHADTNHSRKPASHSLIVSSPAPQWADT